MQWFIASKPWDFISARGRGVALTRDISVPAFCSLIEDTDAMTTIRFPVGVVCILNQPNWAATLPPDVSMVLSHDPQDGLNYYPSCHASIRIFNGWSILGIANILQLTELPRDESMPMVLFNDAQNLDEMTKYPELKTSIGYYANAKQHGALDRMAWCYFYGSAGNEKGHGRTPLHTAVDTDDAAAVSKNLEFNHKYSDGPIHETAFALAVRLKRWSLANLIFESDPQIMYSASFTETEWLRAPLLEAVHNENLETMEYFSLKTCSEFLVSTLAPYIPTVPSWFLENIRKHWTIAWGVITTQDFNEVPSPPSNACDAFRFHFVKLPVVWPDPQTDFLPPPPTSDQRDERTLQQRCAACILLNKLITDELPESLANWILK